MQITLENVVKCGRVRGIEERTELKSERLLHYVRVLA